ncbi:hypothetical protein HRbin40_01997 [bacterium HR40]|nr:hypothetical protein HRbin40_01997 [bacterium HR40]
MTLPLYDSGAFSALFVGFLFGWVLEGAGFGSARKLTGQFLLRDWTVFKVMFTAVLVAAFGLWLFETLGWLAPDGVFVSQLLVVGTALGGLLIGAGFAIGGYCPGTSAVGLASGRLDALFFMIGMVIGSAVFAAVFDVIGPVVSAEAQVSPTLPEFFGVPALAVILALTAVAVLGWRLGSRLEARFGGPLGVEQVLAGLAEEGSTRRGEAGFVERAVHPAE